MNSITQVFILAILPSIVASCFYTMMHQEDDSFICKFFDNIICAFAFLVIYIIEIACIS